MERGMAQQGKSVKVAVERIRLDGGTQMRDHLNQDVVIEYGAAMADIEEKRADGQIVPSFPPPVLFYDGTEYWCGDGFHRIHGHIFRHRQAKKVPAIECIVLAGTRRDAVLYAAQANAAHGLPRTAADKRRAVEMLLRDEEWSKWSDREIARRCSVSHTFVANLRRELFAGALAGEEGVSLATVASETAAGPVERTYTTKHGTVATMRLPERAAAALAEAVGVREPERALPAVGGPQLTHEEFAARLEEAVASLPPLTTPGAVREAAEAEKRKMEKIRELGYRVRQDSYGEFVIRPKAKGGVERYFKTLDGALAAARDAPSVEAAGDETELAYIEQVQELRELGYVVSDTPGHIGVYVTAGPEGLRGFFSDPARALEQARRAVRQATQPQAVEQAAAQPAGGAEAGVDHKEAMEKFRELGYSIYWDKGPGSIAGKPWRLHTPRKGQPDLMEHYATLDEALAVAIEAGPTAGAMAAVQEQATGGTITEPLYSSSTHLSRQLASAAPAQAAANGWPAADKMAVHYSSKTVEHYTPREVIEAVLEVWGQIDLDPCSNSRSAPNVPAMRHFTAAENGLAQEWNGKVFVNPPYGTEIGGWVTKFGEERAAGRVTEAIWLIPARTDTQWFRTLTAECTLACFVSGRLRFGGNGEGDPAPFPSMLVYFGRRDEEFAKVFRRLGPIWAMVQPEVEDGVPV